MTLEDKIEKNLEQQQVLINLRSAGYLEPEIYHAEKNTLMVEADRLQKAKQILSDYVSALIAAAYSFCSSPRKPGWPKSFL